MSCFFITAPNNASSATSAPRLDDASMTYLGRAEGIIKAEFGEPELKLRQQNQQTAFKVIFVYVFLNLKFPNVSSSAAANRILSIWFRRVGS